MRVLIKRKDTKIWFSLRTLFWIMIILWVSGLFILDYILDSILIFIYFGIWLSVTLAVFIKSIIHLIKFKQKGYAITSLVISLILLILFVSGGISYILKTTDTTNEYYTYCHGICFDEPNLGYIEVDSNPADDLTYICTCLDKDQEVLSEHVI